MPALDDAIAGAVEARFAPARERADRVRAALAKWECFEREAIAMSVQRDVIRALGVSFQAADDEATRARSDAARELHAAMKDLLPAPGVPAKRLATADETARAEQIRAELAAAESASMPTGRLLLVLRACAAEARAIMDPLVSSDPTHDALADALDTILEIRKRSGIVQFIVGVQLSSEGDWTYLAEKARAKIERGDKEVAASSPKLKVVGRR